MTCVCLGPRRLHNTAPTPSPCAGAWADKIALGPAVGGRPRSAEGVLVRPAQGPLKSAVSIAVRAGAVISSAGSLHTPALLLRSGVTCRGNVGRHLRLHPVCMTMGLLSSPPKRPATLPDLEDLGVQSVAARVGSVRPWDGTGMSVFSAALGDWEGSGYGALLYTPQIMPAMTAATLPWVSPADYKKLLARMGDLAIFLTIVRDTGEGERVDVGGWGNSLVEQNVTVSNLPLSIYIVL